MNTAFLVALIYLFLVGIIDLIWRKIYSRWLYFSFIIGAGGSLNSYPENILLYSFVSALILCYIFEKLGIWARGDTIVTLTLSLLLPYLYIVIVFAAFGILMIFMVIEDHLKKVFSKRGIHLSPFYF